MFRPAACKGKAMIRFSDMCFWRPPHFQVHMHKTGGLLVQKGRLTTQHITAAGLGGPTVVVHMRGVPPHGAALECPMAVSLSISNTTRRPLGSLHLVLQSAAGSITAEPFLMIGQQSERMESVPPRSTVSLHLMLLPVVTGMQTLSGACVTDDAARLVATLPDTTIFVRN